MAGFLTMSCFFNLIENQKIIKNYSVKRTQIKKINRFSDNGRKFSFGEFINSSLPENPRIIFFQIKKEIFEIFLI